MWRPFFKHRIVGEETMIKLSPGDIYAMSKSAVGVGWMRDTHKRIIYRHRAGSKTFLQRHDTELKKRYGKTYQSTKFTCSSIQDALKPAAELRIKRHRSDLGVTPQRPEKQSKKRKAADGSVRKFWVATSHFKHLNSEIRLFALDSNIMDGGYCYNNP